MFQLRAEGGATSGRWERGGPGWPGPAVGRGRIPVGQEGEGEVGRGHPIKTAGFVPRGAARKGFSQACSPLPLNQPRASRGRGGREGGPAV